jgi:hypothetical protein
MVSTVRGQRLWGLDSIISKNISAIKLYNINGNLLKYSYTGMLRRIGSSSADVVQISSEQRWVLKQIACTLNDLYRGDAAALRKDRCIIFYATNARNHLIKGLVLCNQVRLILYGYCVITGRNLW